MTRILLLCMGAGCVAAIAATGSRPVTAAAEELAENELLWTIGEADDDAREFALAPDGYAKFVEDPVFGVGWSETPKDWPYVQPGPSDVWAGSRAHTFTIVFSLASDPPDGTYRLVVDLCDTHWGRPPVLELAVNERRWRRSVPRGAGGDATINGDAAKGKEHRIELTVPVDALKKGLNDVSISSVEGSWILYDAVAMEGPPGVALARPEGTIVRGFDIPPVLRGAPDALRQPLGVRVLHFGSAADIELAVGTEPPRRIGVEPGSNVLDASIDAVDREVRVPVVVRARGRTICREDLVVRPVRRWTVYLLPHSHVDIGYTQLQAQVERDHYRFYEEALEASRRTAGYPEGSRFKWNVEVLWATDGYLRQAGPEDREAFVDAVRKGWIGLDALYGNELTGLCRPEELVRLTDCALRLRDRYGLRIDSAMISDVPGYTWGIVPVLEQSGVRWFSVGPNGGHRIGHTLSEWGDRPFWWVSPCGQHRVLTWVARTGYYRSLRGEAELFSYLRQKEDEGYPYDILQLRHCLGDNAGPGVALSEFVRDWNSRHAYPHLRIATTREMFEDFEARYGDDLPEIRGDFTPYWEDGAASSAKETALNRTAAERLVQAEILWTLLAPQSYPHEEFLAAWRNVLLYDEHTWGAYNSISQPDSDFVAAQWKTKRGFAIEADRQSRSLLDAALSRVSTAPPKDARVTAVSVCNTSSWPRTDLVVLPPDTGLAGDVVKDAQGRFVPSQRLSSGALSFLARDVPALAASRYRIEGGTPRAGGNVEVSGTTLSNEWVRLALDPKTGAITSLRLAGVEHEFVGAEPGRGLNGYFYVRGRDPKDPQGPTAVRIRVKERGPLVGSLLVSSEAPGCKGLEREVRLIAGVRRVDLINTLDKERVREKEGVHFGFFLNVPHPVMMCDVPFGAVRPNSDQLSGSCKNYLSVGRWVDVSNEHVGVTWATVDAPLVEVGEITTDAIAYRGGWIKSLPTTSTFFSYVMNNYWETNYRSDQEGLTTFRYSLLPHREPDLAASQRFGMERSQPLFVLPVAPDAPSRGAPFVVDSDGAVLSAYRPSRDRRARVLRLFNATGTPTTVDVRWAEPGQRRVTRTNLTESARRGKVEGPFSLPPWSIETLRIE